MLRRTMNVRIGRTGLPATYVASLWTAAAAGAAVAWGIKIALPALHPVVAGVLILGPYGLVYFGVAIAFKISEAPFRLAELRRTAVGGSGGDSPRRALRAEGLHNRCASNVARPFPGRGLTGSTCVRSVGWVPEMKASSMASGAPLAARRRWTCRRP